ncbi:tripartite tricarboxylate transporter permease [Bosea sp. BK604]|uniref:tripartite tricarboxylate transporter permease n=1 Tax=Bosea sp. BK604 TaxID=2512180 RepID=UPI00104901A3|nr:tripartite tricarboxylate transporter permease [Bosea sp. BK604]TCR63482.1 putative tricarboxylic transport membrane protein [Bosea sp. BK604]
MEFSDALFHGLGRALSIEALLAVSIGVTWGIIAGALPGITASIGMALILPFTWGYGADIALMLLAGVYVGAEYGGSIPAILIRSPGEPSNAPAALDGYAMHARGETGKALGYSLVPGTIASLIGAVAMIALLAPLARLALSFGPPEYFALAIFGISAVVGLARKSLVKGIASAAFGLVLATVGPDNLSGEDRFTYGIPGLLDGISTVTGVIGLLAVSEMFAEINQSNEKQEKISTKVRTTLPSVIEYMRTLPATLIGTVIGIIVGVMPGAGATVASFLAYTESRRFSKDGDRYGQGVPDAIAAPEAANNSAVPTSLVPLLAFGIPGSSSAAIMLGALVMHGLRPGPQLLTGKPEFVYALFGGLITATIAMYVLGRMFIKPWIYILNVPKHYLITIILVVVVVGMLGLNLGVFQVYVVLIAGMVGFLMQRYGFNPVAAVLGLVLGALIEENFRRALVMSRGSLEIFLTRPVSAALLLLALASIAFPLVSEWRKNSAREARSKA